LLLKYIPSDLIGLSVQLIPAILYLQFLSIPIHTPSVLFLFNNKPENEPNISISCISFKTSSLLENKIEKMNKLFCAWGKRNLSILGKILIIKSLILSLFTVLASVCLVPDIYHKEIEKKCFKCIWNGKPDKVKRNLIINSYERGGLQMYIKSLFIQFSKAIGLFSKVMCLLPQIICFLISMNVTGYFV
jgi:hypothetical protein